MNPKNKLFLIFLAFYGIFAHAQLKEDNLSNPNNGTLSGHDQERIIYYGATPSNWNGKTIVFTHGYNGTNATFIDNNALIYKSAFNNGYKTVFITTTKGESMETNAALFAEGLEQVKAKLGTSKFYMAAYSNGGKSIDLALSIYGKNDMAIKVATLGTPLKGTQIANAGQWPGISWVASTSYPNAGMETSTTYYMENVRNIVDNHPNNDPSKFYHIGHIGYNILSNNGFTSYLQNLATGNIIKAMGGGNNDGTTPYYSHYKTGGHIVLQDGEGKRNHSNLPNDEYSWNKILEIFGGDPSYPIANKSAEKADSQSAAEFSDYQLVYNDKPQLIIKKDEEKYELVSIKEKIQSPRDTLSQTNTYKKGVYIAPATQEKYLNIYKSTENTGFLLERDAINERLIIKDIQGADLKNSIIQAGAYMISKKSDADYTKQKQLPVSFKYDSGTQSYIASLKDFRDGIYTMNIHIENDRYARDLISGFVMGKISFPPLHSTISNETKPSSRDIAIVNNVLLNTAYVLIQEPISTPVDLSIYDTSGRQVFKNTYTGNSGSIELPSLQKGMYIVNVSFNSKNASLKYLK
ncbi:T9SS type A sorting domain-containing protein [Chryseobacterium sp.]|uniref:T9SS type A sorting domain-containing protein n=1 Tax=Chryseobacterium sp. TaxID=1871047 RepID=UPI0025B9F951|nr:T9SS type A sorting domain-containing protein [Chryseobacterium sp.]